MALVNGSALYISFLRPLALPRASTIHRFFSTSPSISSTSTSSPSTDPSSSSPPTQSLTTPQAEGTPTHTTSTKQPTQHLPYRVNRTLTANLPVYLDTKRGGNLQQTRLQKIEGDINTLRTDLRDELKLEDKDVVINQLTSHIIIRGFRKPEVMRFLKSRGF